MKALYYDSKKLNLVDADRPMRRPKEALIRVRNAGICATDLEILKGYMNFKGIPGHEFVGEVVSPRRSPFYGKRVVGEINIPCGRCSFCKAGLHKHCPNRKVLGIDGKDGAFAEYLVLPISNLHEIPDSISDEEAVFVEPLAAACEFLDREPISPGEKVLIVGDGKLAALTAQVIASETNDITVLGRSDSKLSFFRKLGIRTKNIARMPSNKVGSLRQERNMRTDDAIEKKYNLPNKLYETAIECTGSPEGLFIASRLLMPRGRIILKSTYHESLKWNPASIVINEVRIVGSRCGPFNEAIDLIRSGKILLKPLITAIYPIEEWHMAFKKAKERDSFKIVIRF